MKDGCDFRKGDLRLYTIGYEGTSIDEFTAALIEARIDVLVDIRELPLSRKKGFSKNSLREAVEARGIRYEHIRALGDPRPGRLAAREKRYGDFRRIFRSHLSGSDAQNALSDLGARAKNETICLLCFEYCEEHCHRKIVADEIGDNEGVVVHHLRANGTNRR